MTNDPSNTTHLTVRDPDERVTSASTLPAENLTADEEQRDRWPSRFAFILAACGSAVGLGNMLRFPGVIAEQDAGLAFFIPYFIGLFLVGIPLLILEFSLGQASRSGDILAFAKINRHLRGIGVSSAYASVMVGFYYNVIMAWILIYFVKSFSPQLPWSPKPGDTSTLSTSSDYFMNGVVRPVDKASNTSNIIGSTYFAGLVAWLMVFFCLWRGVRTTGKVVYVTMCVPIVLLIVLIIRAVTLENAGEGILLYVGRFNAIKLANGGLWVAAVSHIFFSIGVGFGVMTAYASYNNPHQDAVQDALIVGLSNSAYEILAGFAVFGVIGFLGPANVGKNLGTFSMGFITYPVALSKLPAPQVWNVIFFANLVMLGLDSAFSLIEPGVTAIKDSRRFNKYSISVIVAVFCMIGLITMGLYASDIGLYALDVVDALVNNVSLIFIAFAKVWAATTWYRAREIWTRTGVLAFTIFNGGWAFSWLLAALMGYLTNGLVGGVIGLVLNAITAGLGSFLAFQRGACDLLWFGQCRLLCDDLNTILCPADTKRTRRPLYWALILKYFTTPGLSALFVVVLFDLANTQIQKEMSWLGVIVSMIAPLLIILGIFYPNLYLPLLPLKNTGLTAGTSMVVCHDEEVPYHTSEKSAYQPAMA